MKAKQNIMQYGTDFGAMWFRKERRRFKEKENIDESQAKFYAVWYWWRGNVIP